MLAEDSAPESEERETWPRAGEGEAQGEGWMGEGAARGEGWVGEGKGRTWAAGAVTRYTTFTPPACSAHAAPPPRRPACCCVVVVIVVTGSGSGGSGAAAPAACSRRRDAVTLTMATSQPAGRLSCTAWVNDA